MFCTFSLQNVLFATAACNFWCLLSAPSSAPAALTGLLLDWPDTRIYEKTQHFVTSLTFGACVSSFLLTFWLLHLLSTDLTTLLLLFNSPYCRKFLFKLPSITYYLSFFNPSLYYGPWLKSHLDLLAIKVHELLFQLTLFAFPQGIGTGSRQNHPRNAKRLVIFENLSSRLCQFTQFFSDLPSGQLHALLTHVAVIQQSQQPDHHISVCQIIQLQETRISIGQTMKLIKPCCTRFMVCSMVPQPPRCEHSSHPLHPKLQFFPGHGGVLRRLLHNPVQRHTVAAFKPPSKRLSLWYPRPPKQAPVRETVPTCMELTSSDAQEEALLSLHRFQLSTTHPSCESYCPRRIAHLSFKKTQVPAGAKMFRFTPPRQSASQRC